MQFWVGSYLSLLYIPLYSSLHLYIKNRGTEMVASEEEVKTIMRILKEYWPETTIEMMLRQVWDNVGQYSDNESLKATIQMMIKDIETEFMVKEKNVRETK